MQNTLLLLVVLFGALVTCAESPIGSFLFAEGLHLIEFNETDRRWMTTKEVEQLDHQECGAGTGFMDVTNHPDLSPLGLKAAPLTVGFPPGPSHQTYVKSLFPSLSASRLTEYNNVLSSYHTRYYTTQTGVNAAQWIKATFDANKAGRTDIEVSLFQHSGWIQPSVIARIQGTDPQYANELVIVGAHEDSIRSGSAATGRAPGADDDASGTVTVLEIFRVLAAAGYKPGRTLEFHTYAGEEAGLRGSQDIAATYQRQGKVVYAMLQLDMTFYKSSPARVGIITDHVSAPLTTYLRTLIPAYTNLPFSDGRCGYGCSDHASWTKAGFDACFPFEAPYGSQNPNIHTGNDVISILSVPHGLQFAQLGLGFLVELSSV
jgi:leucyl aminopeptidase